MTGRSVGGFFPANVAWLACAVIGMACRAAGALAGLPKRQGPCCHIRRDLTEVTLPSPGTAAATSRFTCPKDGIANANEPVSLPSAGRSRPGLTSQDLGHRTRRPIGPPQP